MLKTYTVDLYDYFKVKKPNGCKCELRCYISDVSKEYSEGRLRPAMLVIPGGGYAFCSDREGEPIALRYLAYGYNTFVIYYSVAPDVRYPVALQEAAMAMCYIRLNAKELGVRADNVAAVGFSAGGHLCGCLATLFEEKCLDFLGENKKLVRPDASLLIYPVISYTNHPHRGSFLNLTDSEEERIYLSLENRVTEKSSPAFIVSTFGDGAVPCQNALAIANAYANIKVPFALHVFEKGEHGMSTVDYCTYYRSKNLSCASYDFPKWIELSLNFLKEHGFDFIDIK